MDRPLLVDIANRYLIPLFSGASLEDKIYKSGPRDGLVSFRDPQSIYFKTSKRDRYKLAIVRSQPFAVDGSTPLPEKSVIQAFAEIVGEMAEQLKGPLSRDLLSTFQRRVVARALGGETDSDIILTAIDQLAIWGGRLYEGAPISAAVGLRNKPQLGEDVTLAHFVENDFGSLVSNGHDTILEFDFEGRFIGHRALFVENGQPSFCPIRQVPIADWTTSSERRLAIVLNRLGEVLVFRQHQLIFARRSGQWHFMTHEPVLKQMATPKEPTIRKAVYETCIDASFARTGACIGVVSSADHGDFAKIVSKDDWLSRPVTIKSKSLSKIISGRKFHEIDRRLRQELVAIDGATILSHSGDVLAIGAIVQVPGGSSGGGRLAAAKQLAKLGLGIKISQDGGISGFKKGSTAAAFKIM